MLTFVPLCCGYSQKIIFFPNPTDFYVWSCWLVCLININVSLKMKWHVHALLSHCVQYMCAHSLFCVSVCANAWHITMFVQQFSHWCAGMISACAQVSCQELWSNLTAGFSVMMQCMLLALRCICSWNIKQTRLVSSYMIKQFLSASRQLDSRLCWLKIIGTGGMILKRN